MGKIRMEIPIVRDIEARSLSESIQNFLKRTGIDGSISYHKGALKSEWAFLLKEYSILGTLVVEIRNAHGIDEWWVARRLNALINERAIPFPDNKAEQIERVYEEIQSKKLAIPADEVRFAEGLWNSVSALKRSAVALWKIDQFIHLWRSFNALYSSIYQRYTGKDLKHTEQEKMFGFILEKFLSWEECEELVEHFVKRYDLRWLAELKIGAKMLTKEGWKNSGKKE